MKKKVSLTTRVKRLWAKRIYEEAAGTIIYYRNDKDSKPKFLLIERGCYWKFTPPLTKMPHCETAHVKQPVQHACPHELVSQS